MPRSVRSESFGAPAAVWAVLDDLGVPGLIDETAGSAGAGACVVAAVSMHLVGLYDYPGVVWDDGLGEWWGRTAGPRFTGIPSAALDGGFLAAARALTADQAKAVGSAISERAAQMHGQSVRRYEAGVSRLDDELADSPFLAAVGGAVPWHVSGLVCQTAVHAARLLRLKARKAAGLPRTTSGILRELAGIYETVLIYDGDRSLRMLAQLSPRQDALTQALGLARYAPPS